MELPLEIAFNAKKASKQRGSIAPSIYTSALTYMWAG
jgi:hypothetical protein